MKLMRAPSKTSKAWKPWECSWGEFVEEISIPLVKKVSSAEYADMNKDERSKVKDVKCYVGGLFSSEARKKGSMVSRELITLDLDTGTINQDELWEAVEKLNCNYIIHETMSSTYEVPRFRLIIPLKDPILPQAYKKVAEEVAELIGIEHFDKTSFQSERLMYWPSCLVDRDFDFFKVSCSTKGGYSPKNIMSRDEIDLIRIEEAKKQVDPRTKDGHIGAFCRVYTIKDAIETFLSDFYVPSEHPDRYTFLEGSSSGGLVIYNNLFAFSHHESDPTSGKLCNAYDLVMHHLFPADLAWVSEDKMLDFIRSDENTQQEFLKANKQVASSEFGEWAKELEINMKTGAYQKTRFNIDLVLRNDPNLKGCIVFDEVFSKLAYKPIGGKVRAWNQADSPNIKKYLERTYGIDADKKIDDTIISVAQDFRYNPIKEYLEPLVWDGVERVSTLLHDYLGADRDIYTSTVMRKSLIAACRRGALGLTKYDQMIILTGAQGIGKSTFLRYLGKEWYSDTVSFRNHKEAGELLQGSWIVEMSELAGLNKYENEQVKHFLSSVKDRYRQAYSAHVEEYPRRCVFFGTTNADDFLRDATGERRFYPIKVGLHPPKKSVFKDLINEVDQIWAEVYHYMKKGEVLTVSHEVNVLAKQAQDDHKESNEKDGIIKEFIELNITDTWDSIDIETRKLHYLTGAIGNKRRDTICVAEIWAECFMKNKADIKRSDSQMISNVLKNLEGWTEAGVINIKNYGKQRAYKRIT